MLYKIPNDNDYFKDAMLLFIAAAQREQKLPSFSNDIVKMILTPETTSLIRNNLEALIDKHQMTSFMPIKVDTNHLQATDKSQLRVDRGS